MTDDRFQDDTELICVKVFLSEQEAEIAKGLLESGGIRAILTPAADPSQEGFTFTKGNQIWVRKEDAEAARELLGDKSRGV
ncbi:MAG TPA: DUF2007 domain-containing protein [Candidatus Omnitrophota bacterium]|nr:DUF2007 domain-containing protein [Candidatus Omnitrophota bacterium]